MNDRTYIAIQVLDGEFAGKTVYVNESLSPKEIVELLGVSIDYVGALENYYDPEWVEKNRLTLENVSEIYETPMNELLQEYKLYNRIDDNGVWR